MNKQTTRFRNLTFGTMCILTLFCIAFAVKNNAFRDSYLALINIAGILGVIFITLLTGLVLLKTKERTAPRRMFTLFLLDLYLAIFFTVLANCLYMRPDSSLPLTILSSLSYFFSMALFLILWFYQKQFLEETVVTRIITVVISLAFAVYTALLIINLFRPVFFLFTEEGVYSEGVLDYISITFDFSCLALLCIATFSSRLSLSRKFSFLSCIFAPVLFVALFINSDLLNRYIYVVGVLITTVLLPLCLIFYNTHNELENEVIRREKEQIKLQVSAMISQMQPHFLYNSLAVIEALCEEDPHLAAEATNAFSNYLRENMDFADKSNPISFSEELNHIKTYVWLEKLRFPNKLNVEYDIQCTSFPVPALSVQPIVENAIKHGICKSKSGGTVRICTFETEGFYCVTVHDDGIGFDISEKLDDGKRHLGINNARYRIREMVGGSLTITSTPGEGTEVVIKIPSLT